MNPTTAHLDGDIIAYQVAFWAETYDPDKIPKQIKKTVKEWTPKGVNEVFICLSCSRSDNFRRDIWDAYKRNREDAYVPEYLHDIKDYLQQEYWVKEIDRLEADDIMGIEADESIAVTIDKDLLGVSGWHFNPSKDKEVRFIEPEEAEYFFYKQWMTGDSTDNIPGLWRIGPKKAERYLNEWDKTDWDANILDLYESDRHRVRNYDSLDPNDIAIAMARCVNILSVKTYDKDTGEMNLFTPKCG